MVIQGNFWNSIGQIRSGFVNVGTTPTIIAVDSGRPMKERSHILLSLPPNSAAAAVYVGDENVAVGTGIPVDSDSGIIIPVNMQGGAGRFYMIADTACKINVVEMSE